AAAAPALPPPPVVAGTAQPAERYSFSLEPIYSDMNGTRVVLLAQLTREAGDADGNPVLVPQDTIFEWEAAEAQPQAAGPAVPAQVRQPPGWDTNGLIPFLVTVWLAGAALCLLRAGWHLWRFQRLLRHARPAPVEVQDQASELARQMGLGRCPAVWLVP